MGPYRDPSEASVATRVFAAIVSRFRSNAAARLAAALLGAAPIFGAPVAAQEGAFVPGPYIEVLAECYGGARTTPDRRACIGKAAAICQEEEPQGQTTLGLVTCVGIEADAWDVVLNGEYQLAMEWARQADATGSAPEFARRADTLRAAQRAWIEFRDAECILAYALWGSGSMRRIAGAECQLRMIAERGIDLRAMREEM